MGPMIHPHFGPPVVELASSSQGLCEGPLALWLALLTVTDKHRQAELSVMTLMVYGSLTPACAAISSHLHAPPHFPL